MLAFESVLLSKQRSGDVSRWGEFEQIWLPTEETSMSTPQFVHFTVGKKPGEFILTTKSNGSPSG